MKGIDRLREYVKDAPASSMGEMARAIVAGMADEIGREAEDMVPLPLDADGVPIHVGDVMEADNGTTFEVEHISLYPWGWRCVGEGTDRSGVTCTAHAIPDGCHHHYAPTVEDVLREFTDEVWNRCCEGATASDSGIDELVAEYAAKLALRGDE